MGWSTKASRRAHGCGLWCCIRVGWDRFSQHMALVVGEGNLILFWHYWWAGDIALKLLYPDLFVCLGDKEAFIFDVMVHQVDWVFRSWNLRLHRDFHDWKLEAVFSFLEHIYSRFPRGEGIERMHWCLKGSGQFDSLFIRWFGLLLSLHFHGRVFGSLRFLKGFCSLCG